MSEYLQYKELLKDSDILLIYKKKNIISRFIVYFQETFFKKIKSKYKASHALIYLGNGITIEATFIGVVIKQLQEYKKEDVLLYIARYKGMNDEIHRKILESAVKREGEHYSYKQLLLLLIKYLFKLKRVGDADKKAVVCTELVVNSYIDGGVYLFPDIVSAEVAPFNFFDCERLNIIEINSGD